MVSIEYDPITQIIYIKFNEQKSAKAIPTGETQYLNISESGKAVGLEIIDDTQVTDLLLG
jgi:uncharacterized protein YuzE